MTGRELRDRLLAALELRHHRTVRALIESGEPAAAVYAFALGDALAVWGDALMALRLRGVFKPGTGFEPGEVPIDLAEGFHGLRDWAAVTGADGSRP